MILDIGITQTCRYADDPAPGGQQDGLGNAPAMSLIEGSPGRQALDRQVDLVGVVANTVTNSKVQTPNLFDGVGFCSDRPMREGDHRVVSTLDGCSRLQIGVQVFRHGL